MGRGETPPDLGADTWHRHPACQSEAARPNVLFVSIDDMNGWIEPFNEPARGKPLMAATNLQQLANQGVAFKNAHTPVPLCKPTRASIMGGSIRETTVGPSNNIARGSSTASRP